VGIAVSLAWHRCLMRRQLFIHSEAERSLWCWRGTKSPICEGFNDEAIRYATMRQLDRYA